MNKKITFIFIAILVIVSGFSISKSIIFSDSKVLILKSESSLNVKEGYVVLNSFILEDNLVKLNLVSNIGSPDDWKNALEISIFDKVYTLKTNVVQEVSQQGTIYFISCIGEVIDLELQSKGDAGEIKTPFGTLQINYQEKRKLYY